MKVTVPVAHAYRDGVRAAVGDRDIQLAIVIEIGDRYSLRRRANRDSGCSSEGSVAKAQSQINETLIRGYSNNVLDAVVVEIANREIDKCRWAKAKEYRGNAKAAAP